MTLTCKFYSEQILHGRSNGYLNKDEQLQLTLGKSKGCLQKDGQVQVLARTNPSVLNPWLRSAEKAICKSYIESGELTHSNYDIYTGKDVAVRN